MFLLFLFLQLGISLCNDHDKDIYRILGPQFKSLFRSLVGWWPPSRETYITNVQTVSGLSMYCATCYGDAYICGYNNCKLACLTAGNACDKCLELYECAQNCNKCTGF